MLRFSLPVVVLALLGTACSDVGPGETTRNSDPPVTTTIPEGSAPTSSTTQLPPDGEVVPIEAVLDGDSLAVTRNGERTEVRLAGINTPERDECHGDEARALMQDLTGDEVILVRVGGEDDKDQFGRLLRNAWSGGTWLNLRMVQEGAALALQAGSEDEAQLIAAEDEAWRNALGMWGGAVCGEFVEGVEVADVRYNPPGRDFENKEEEYVVLENRGTEPVDMSGWIVRDESSTHRYHFADGFVLATGDTVRLRTGCGDDRGGDIYWCNDDAVWSNGGDTVLLQSATGTVVDRWKYEGDF